MFQNILGFDRAFYKVLSETPPSPGENPVKLVLYASTNQGLLYINLSKVKFGFNLSYDRPATICQKGRTIVAKVDGRGVPGYNAIFEIEIKPVDYNTVNLTLMGGDPKEPPKSKNYTGSWR
ncbi:MAG: hypothetical protein AB7G93_09350 [Bdellovibrionales bacterium]